MDPSKTNLIVGPPGTGKTTELLRITESLLESGVPPNEICFVAFTRKAANEARDRACVKFNFEPAQLPWFRTLHSFAFFQLALTKSQVLGYGDYLKIAQSLGLTITFKGASEDGTITGLSRGDRLFFMENMARAQLMDLRTYWEKYPDEDIYWYELEQLATTLKQHKSAFGKVDFTDMMVLFAQNPVVPKLHALIIDEAQDLTPLQWRVAEHLSEDIEEVYIAGDDDQAIFKWAGADVERFIDMPGTRRVLPQSYRVPVFIQGLAEQVVSRITKRIPKEWLPTKETGGADFVNEIADIDLSQGSWLLLARNVYLLQQYNEHCIQEGFVFTSHLGSPVKSSSLTSIVMWEKLRKGESIPGAMAKNIYDLIASANGGVARGFKKLMEQLPDDKVVDMQYLRKELGLCTDKIWHEALDRIPIEEREYFLAALRRGEKLLKEPRIRIETIHGVKGGEADNVVICLDMAERTWREFEQNPDDEHRVWYVAITRAKKRLYILSPKTNRCYDI